MQETDPPLSFPFLSARFLTRLFFALFWLTLFFPRRTLLFSLPDNFYGQIIPFTDWFFYLPEIFLALTLLGTLLFFSPKRLTTPPRYLWAILFSLLVSALLVMPFHPSPNLNLLRLTNLLSLFALTYLLSCRILSLRTTLNLLLFSLAFQALLGLTQFITQSDLSLSFLGEPSLSPSTLGVAKLSPSLLRPTGTLPHANAWGGALLIGLFLLPTWFRQNKSKDHPLSLQRAKKFLKAQWWLPLVFFLLLSLLVISALLSFSRSVWLGLLFLFLSLLFYPRFRLPALLSALTFSALLLLTNSSLFLSRFSSLSSSFSERQSHYLPALQALTHHPLGLGAGRFTSFLSQSQPDTFFAPWELQPPHNFFLLIAVEWGFPALLIILLATIVYLLLTIRTSLLRFAQLLALGALLSLDHYFWTHFPLLVLLALTLYLFEISSPRKKTTPIKPEQKTKPKPKPNSKPKKKSKTKPKTRSRQTST